jgi:hypothetical protein
MQFADDINVAEKSLNTHASRAMGVLILSLEVHGVSYS